MLGSHLKYVREQLHESVAEVSGAVEIDETDLANIEQGLTRPSEDVLMLLISHYDMQDQEAVQLWELAGYSSDSAPVTKLNLDDLASSGKQMVMLLAMDMRTMYSDGLDVAINQAGLTLTFTQAGGKNKRMPVARIGMSYEQAREVISTLQTALIKAAYLKNPRGLPHPRSAEDKTAN